MFKVVKMIPYTEKLVSATQLPDTFMVEYKPRVKTHPIFAGSKLFVFQEYAYAHEFVMFICREFELSRLLIYECDAENPKEADFCSVLHSEMCLTSFWEGSMDVRHLMYPVTGSFLADSVTLTNLRFDSRTP